MLFPFKNALADFDPADPDASGYRIVFDDEFKSSSTIDVHNELTPGFKWYTGQFYGMKPTPSTAFHMSQAGLVLTQDNADLWGNDLCTAGPAQNDRGFVGQAWGGGAYFEATFNFTPATVDGKNGWPAFWSNALEGCVQKTQWPGQAKGYAHYSEDDFFEYNPAWWGFNGYGATMHDWYGIWNVTCPGKFCDIANNHDNLNLIKVPEGTDFTRFHTYSQLWVPGAVGHRGYVNNYFDGKLMSQTAWADPPADAPYPGPPPSDPYTFSVLDDQHLTIYLGTGNDQPMTFKSVRVWQIPGKGTCIGDCTPPAQASTGPGAGKTETR